jgi:hypothetical protein
MSINTKRARAELTGLLRDERFDYGTRLLRLQGWRGAELARAVDAGNAARLAPGFCSLGGAVVALTASWELALILMATAVVGVFARNHPVEAVYNRLAPSLGRERLPANRAAKRLGCLIGTAFLGASALSTVVGATSVATAFAGVLAVVAGFVTITNICVPSAIFVALFGRHRSTACALISVKLPGHSRRAIAPR